MDAIRDPEVPFVGRIKGGFTEGKMVRIQGFTAPTAERFNINLQTGSETNPRDDTALHLSVRIIEGYVARNSLKNGNWGDEQGQGELLIGPGQQFEIIIMCAASDFKVAINGKHFCEFPQRIPTEDITHLAVDGDVSISVLSFEGGDGGHSRSTASSQESGGPYGASAPNPYGPPQGEYGPPQGQYGPPQGQYGPPQGQYGPPQGQYGPPQGQGPYGGYGGQPQYAGGPPPGHQEQDSGFDFLGQAGSIIAGAISSGMAEKLIGSLTSGGHGNADNHHGQQQHNQNQQYATPSDRSDPLGLPGLDFSQLTGGRGGGSAGGLGSIGSLLSGFMDQALHPQHKDDPRGHH